MSEAKEKCAVAAVSAVDRDFPASTVLREGLFGLQHRGMEASGIVNLTDELRLEGNRDDGFVTTVHTDEKLKRLTGRVAVGHNRYSTSGSKNGHPQPVMFGNLAHGMNGNLPVMDLLRPSVESHGINTQGMIDTELMTALMALELKKQRDIEKAMKVAYPIFRGAFSSVVLDTEGTIAAFRDPVGIRPLELGQLEDGGYAVASETRGLDLMGATHLRPIQPGEMVIINGSEIASHRMADERREQLDIFEDVYFASPDSILYGERVNEIRRRMGIQLAFEHPPIFEDLENTIVVPVPDTSEPAAEGYAETLKIPHRAAIRRNRYIVGRSFMQPSQLARRNLNISKHTVIPEAIKGKNIILIDDSIVRGNTLPQLIKRLYAAGAKGIMVLVASPPVRFPDYYGIDTPHQPELIAANLTIPQVKQEIGGDYLGYLHLDGLIKATQKSADDFNLSCFTGEYPIGIGRRKDEISMPVSMEGVE